MHKAVLAGIFTIAAGALGILRLGIELFNIYLINNFSEPGFNSPFRYSNAFIQHMFYLSLAWGIICTVTGAVAIASGIAALKRKHSGFALAGAICGTVAFSRAAFLPSFSWPCRRRSLPTNTLLTISRFPLTPPG